MKNMVHQAFNPIWLYLTCPYSGPGIGPGSDDNQEDYDDYGGYRRDGQVRHSVLKGNK